MVHKAVIQRLRMTLPMATEYLSLDAESAGKRVWSEKRVEAFEFETHAMADDRAAEIRAETGEHVHAAVCEKPMPLRPVVLPNEEDLSGEATTPVPTSRQSDGLVSTPSSGGCVPPAQNISEVRNGEAPLPAREARALPRTKKRRRKTVVAANDAPPASIPVVADRMTALRASHARVSNEALGHQWWREGQYA